MDLIELHSIASIMAGNYHWEARSEQDWQEIGHCLSLWRQRRGITLKSAASALTISTTTLVKFEKGDYTSLRIYIDIWYRMLLAGKSKRFEEICRKNCWFNILLDRNPKQDSAFKVVPREFI